MSEKKKQASKQPKRLHARVLPKHQAAKLCLRFTKKKKKNLTWWGAMWMWSKVNFEIRCNESQKPSECSWNVVLSYFNDLHIRPKNWLHWIRTSLCQVLFFCKPHTQWSCLISQETALHEAFWLTCLRLAKRYWPHATFLELLPFYTSTRIFNHILVILSSCVIVFIVDERIDQTLCTYKRQREDRRETQTADWGIRW